MKVIIGPVKDLCSSFIAPERQRTRNSLYVCQIMAKAHMYLSMKKEMRYI